MTNDSSNLTTADEAITFLVNQGIYDFCEFQHYTSTDVDVTIRNPRLWPLIENNIISDF